ncbi:MAG: acyl-CoA thioester hydrolase/BAAT C-terminal domain-containing protein [Bowdeniella nasicola]|nr:acyl-CoA thioester hydrolase/BAAT C-terminal domain-containing protein [Bowdeniella nasicola]
MAFVVLLSLLGSASGPGWRPSPLTAQITTQSTDTTIGSSALTPPVGSYEVTREVVEVPLTPEVTIKASIYRPEGAPGLRPGMIFLHGAGTATHLRFEPHARALASAGIVTMVPDKRMDTYTVSSRNYLAMADDYERSADLLRSDPQVNPAAVGVYGESEGAYVAPLVAARYPATAFLVLVSAPVVPPREQATFATDVYLRNTGVPRALLTVIPRGLGPQFPGGSLAYADFDVSAYQRQLTCPVFMAYGTADPSMPIVQGALQVIGDLAAAGNADYTVRYYADANHGIKVDDVIVPAFLRDVARFVGGLPLTAGAEPKIAGDQPLQQFQAEPPPRPRWYASGDMIVIGLLAGPIISASAPLVGVVLAGASALMRRWGLRRHGEPSRRVRGPVVAVLLRLSIAASLAAFAAWVLYLAYLATVGTLAVNYETSPLAVDGGWVVTRLAGILAAFVFVLAVRAVHRHLRGEDRLSVPVALTIAGSLLGSAIMLLTGAYWGIFATILTW